MLKALTLVLAPVLPASPHCTHLKRHGGPKGAVRRVLVALPKNRFMVRTDVKSYYASIDHLLLMDRLAATSAIPASSPCSARTCATLRSAAGGSGRWSAESRSAAR